MFESCLRNKASQSIRLAFFIQAILSHEPYGRRVLRTIDSYCLLSLEIYGAIVCAQIL